jgi:glycerophosphoryl diester phosphodiesterase
VNGNQTQVGGLSGITYDPASNNFYIISDDRSQFGPARFYTATIDPTLFTGGGVTFTGVTALRQPNGQTFPALSLDPEGIAIVGSDVYVSSEGEVSANRIIDPFVNRFSVANGQQNQALPIPNPFIPAPNSIPTTSGVRDNLALESLITTPDKRFLFTATENALVQDGPLATLTNGSPSRILQYDLATGQAIAQFLYNTEPVALPPNPSNQFNTNGLVDLLALDNSGKRFLSLERSFSTGAVGTPGNTGNTVKIFEVSLEGATDISGLSSIDGVSGIVSATKTLLLDLTSLNIPIDNVEGITFGPNLANGKRSLILVSDNNFSPTQFTRFLAFSVETVPEPSTLAGLLAIGLGGLFVRKLDR